MLARECSVFGRYLQGDTLPDYIAAKYAAAHEYGSTGPARRDRDDPLDALLLKFASRSVVAAALADAYARFARPGGPLRRKLVLLAAISECAPDTWRAFEPPPPTSAAVVIARVAWRGAVFVLVLASAIVILGPAHLWLRLTGRIRGRRSHAQARV